MVKRIELGAHYCCRFTGATSRALGDWGEVIATTYGRVVVNASYEAAGAYVLQTWFQTPGSRGEINGSASAVQCYTPDTVAPTMEQTLTAPERTSALARPHASVGRAYGALREIKRRYDPAGLFVCHHCVGSEDWDASGNCPAAAMMEEGQQE